MGGGSKFCRRKAVTFAVFMVSKGGAVVAQPMERLPSSVTKLNNPSEDVFIRFVGRWILSGRLVELAGRVAKVWLAVRGWFEDG